MRTSDKFDPRQEHMASVRERSRHAREDDEVTLNHLSVTVDTSLFPDTLKMKVQLISDVVTTSYLDSEPKEILQNLQCLNLQFSPRYTCGSSS